MIGGWHDRQGAMIGKLKGVIDSYGEDHVILDVHGVGYVVLCSAKTLTALPPAGEAAVLSIETQVREDAIRLFGFRSDAEREWFRLLQTVQGVGSKVALASCRSWTPAGSPPPSARRTRPWSPALPASAPSSPPASWRS